MRRLDVDGRIGSRPQGITLMSAGTGWAAARVGRHHPTPTSSRRTTTRSHMIRIGSTPREHGVVAAECLIVSNRGPSLQPPPHPHRVGGHEPAEPLDGRLPSASARGALVALVGAAHAGLTTGLLPSTVAWSAGLALVMVVGLSSVARAPASGGPGTGAAASLPVVVAAMPWIYAVAWAALHHRLRLDGTSSTAAAPSGPPDAGARSGPTRASRPCASFSAERSHRRCLRRSPRSRGWCLPVGASAWPAARRPSLRSCSRPPRSG